MPRPRPSSLDVLLERMEPGFMLVNAEHVVELCSRRAIELLDLPPALMVRRPRFVEVLEHQWSTDEFAQTPEAIKAFVRAGGMLDEVQTYERLRPDGRVIEVHSIPLDGGGMLRTYCDVTARRKTEDDIRFRADHDGLTKLLNRESFNELLSSSIMKATFEGKGFAVHYCDLDRFKPVNDRHGHAVGDMVLAAVARRLRHAARDQDAVARLGGDEFAILQWEASEPAGATGLARRLVEAFAQPIHVEALQVEVGISVGVALFPTNGVTSDGLLKHADDALYRAKVERRGVVVYDASA